MRKILAVLLALVMLFSLCACTGDNPGNSNGPGSSSNPGSSSDPGNGDNPLAGTYNIKVWVSEIAGVAELTKQQIDAFQAANPGVIINATIEGVSEGEAATQMVSDVEVGADIFCFAQDQLARLVMAGALNPLGQQTSATVTEMNDAGAVGAATVGGQLYCFPLTSDNGYFMFYDKSVIPEEHLDSLEDILADCEKAGRNFSYNLEGSAWYNAGFFFATGCVSSWTSDLDGKFTSVNDTFNSPEGVIALRGMQKVLQSSAYVDSSAHADFGAAIPSAVVISGAWDAKTAMDILGENYGATDLPSFTVDGKSYHIGSYSGNKLMGMKPQTDAVRAAVLQQLALYLSGEECQKQRFEQFGWGPSNLNIQALPEVQEDVTLSALAAQSAYAIPECQIHGSWWDIAKVYAVAAKEAAADDTAALKGILDNYTASINGLFNMSADELRAFTVIGSINGDGWSIDIPMTEKSPNVWVTDTLVLKEGDEFKCRQGKSWDKAFPAANFVVETAGTYVIQLTTTGEGDAMTGAVELIPVEPG